MRGIKLQNIMTLKKSGYKGKKEIIIFTGIIILFLLLTLIQINKPIRGEQDFFAYGAHKIVSGEKPEFSFLGYHNPKISILVHPPLYIYTSAFFVEIFGYNLFALKFSGILFAILTSLLLFLMANSVFKNRYYSLAAVFIYLINPLTIQSALMLDMDGGILTFFTAAAIFCFMKYKLSKPFLLGAVISLGLWVKTTSFVILSASFFIFCLFFDKEKKIISGKKAKKILKLILIFTISLAVFFAGYYVYTSFIRLDFLQFIRHNLVQKFQDRNLINILLRAGGGIKTFVIWTTPPVSLFLGFVFLRDFKKIIKRKPDENQIISYIIIIITIIFFAITGVAVSGIGKYFSFLMPLIALIIAGELLKIKSKFSKRIIYAAIMISIVIIEYYLIFLRDPIITKEIWMIFSQFNIFLVLSIALKIAVILLPLILLYFVFKRNFMVSMMVLIFVFLIYSSVYTSFAKYSTINNYGDYGIEETVSYLHSLTGDKNATIIAERGVAYLWNNGNYLDEKNNNAYVYIASGYYVYINEFLSNAVIVPNNTYLVIYEQNLYRTQGFKENLDNNFKFIKSIGYYQIYERRAE